MSMTLTSRWQQLMLSGQVAAVPPQWQACGLPAGVVVSDERLIWIDRIGDDRSQMVDLCQRALSDLYVLTDDGYKRCRYGVVIETGNNRELRLIPGKLTEVTSRRQFWPRVTSLFHVLTHVICKAQVNGIASAALMRLRQFTAGDHELALGVIAGLICSRWYDAVSRQEALAVLADRGLDQIAAVVDDPSWLQYLIADIWSLLATADVRGLYPGQGGYDRLCEDLVAACSPDERGRRGLYVTPPQIVGYVVRSVRQLIDSELSDNVTIIDPACGSGAFLRAVIDEDIPCQSVQGRELMLTPYVFAVMSTGNSDVQVELCDAFSRPVTAQGPVVVIGNPPYSGHSADGRQWIDELVDDYRFVDGRLVNERNVKWLRDDYVKFVRLAQSWVDGAGSGIVAMVTNHGYLDNPTFRGMRYSLLSSFDSAYIVDLHGNLWRRDARSNELDENLFGVCRGVAVSLFVKNARGEQCTVSYAQIKGSRQKKLDALSSGDVTTCSWEPLSPGAGSYLLVPRSCECEREWQKMVSLADLFPVHAVGIVTGNDRVLFDRDRERLQQRFRDHPDADQRIVRCRYRPFDDRWLMYDDGLVERSRRRIMKHMLPGDNVAILAKRQSKRQPFSHVWCTGTIAEGCVLESAYANNSLFPLYVVTERGREVNIDADIRGQMEEQWTWEWSPVDVMGYVYAILHSPWYRQRYGVMLQHEFPRVPVVGCGDLVRSLMTIGHKLLSVHLGECATGDVMYFGESVPEVAAGYPKFEGNAVMLNSRSSRFEPVSREVWEFLIGGYRVCRRWLVDRGRTGLNSEDIDQYRSLIWAVARTRSLMEQIDQAIGEHGGWPL